MSRVNCEPVLSRFAVSSLITPPFCGREMDVTLSAYTHWQWPHYELHAASDRLQTNYYMFNRKIYEVHTLTVTQLLNFNNSMTTYEFSIIANITKGLYFILYLYMGKWWRWALVSPDGVAPSWMVSVSASVNLPLNH